MTFTGDHLWQRGTINGAMDGPRGTVYSSVDGLGVPPAATTDGPWGLIIGGTIRSVTIYGLPFSSCTTGSITPPSKVYKCLIIHVFDQEIRCLFAECIAIFQ